MKLSIDLDGVICNFSSQIVGIANSLWPGKLPLDYEPKNYHYTGDLTHEEWDSVWAKIRTIPDFYEQGPGYEDNLQALRTFLHTQSNHDIYFVTSRSDTGGVPVGLQSSRWLRDNGITSGFNHLAVVPVHSAETKKFVMSDLDIDFSIDDLGVTVEGCSVLRGHKAFLLDRPWNRDKNYGPRVLSMEEFLSKVLRRVTA